MNETVLWKGKYLEVRETKGESSYCHTSRSSDYLAAEIYICEHRFYRTSSMGLFSQTLHRNDATEHALKQGMTSNGRISKSKREKAVERGQLLDQHWPTAKAAKALSFHHEIACNEVKAEAYHARNGAQNALLEAALDGGEAVLLGAGETYRKAVREVDSAEVVAEQHASMKKTFDRIFNDIRYGHISEEPWVLERLKELLPEKYAKMFPEEAA